MTTEYDADTVRLAYELILGRQAESLEAINAHMGLGSIGALRAAMMNSDEFKSKMLAIRYPSSKWVAADVMGQFTMWVDLHDRYVSHGCLNNDWEPSESRYFTDHIACGDTVIDIGANIGWFTLLAAKRVGLNGFVHAIEPRPETFGMLKRTIFDNNLQSMVTVWQLGLADVETDLHLTWQIGTDNPGGSFLVQELAALDSSAVSVRVRCVALDTLLPDIRPSVIKIDVEGAEPKVFLGAKRLLGRCARPVILSELYPAQLMRVSGATVKDYISLMSQFGYKCYLLEDGKPTRRLSDFPVGSSSDLLSVVFE